MEEEIILENNIQENTSDETIVNNTLEDLVKVVDVQPLVEEQVPFKEEVVDVQSLVEEQVPFKEEVVDVQPLAQDSYVETKQEIVENQKEEKTNPIKVNSFEDNPLKAAICPALNVKQQRSFCSIQ